MTADIKGFFQDLAAFGSIIAFTATMAVWSDVLLYAG